MVFRAVPSRCITTRSRSRGFAGKTIGGEGGWRAPAAPAARTVPRRGIASQARRTIGNCRRQRSRLRALAVRGLLANHGARDVARVAVPALREEEERPVAVDAPGRDAALELRPCAFDRGFVYVIPEMGANRFSFGDRHVGDALQSASRSDRIGTYAAVAAPPAIAGEAQPLVAAFRLDPGGRRADLPRAWSRAERTRDGCGRAAGAQERGKRDHCQRLHEAYTPPEPARVTGRGGRTRARPACRRSAGTRPPTPPATGLRCSRRRTGRAGAGSRSALSCSR